jgi:protein-S-isoprenylcysteine O-methyltransferase Ste14
MVAAGLRRPVWSAAVSVWRQARAIALLPGMVTIPVPAAILAVGGVDVGWGLDRPWDVVPVLAGVALIGLGLALWYRTVRLFARAGEGTLAPWDPTRRLVVLGPYRHVRNPMITGVLLVLGGEAGLFGSLGVLAWAGAFLLVNAVRGLQAQRAALDPPRASVVTAAPIAAKSGICLQKKAAISKRFVGTNSP